MIRQVQKYYLKTNPHIAGLQVGDSIPICLSRDGQQMTLEPSGIKGSYQGWDLQIRQDNTGKYCELPLTHQEITTLLGRIVR